MKCFAFFILIVFPLFAKADVHEVTNEERAKVWEDRSFILRRVGGETKGFAVKKSKNDKYFIGAGMKHGDLIVSLNGFDVATNISAYIDAFKNADTLVFKYYRDNEKKPRNAVIEFRVTNEHNVP